MVYRQQTGYTYLLLKPGLDNTPQWWRRQRSEPSSTAGNLEKKKKKKNQKGKKKEKKEKEKKVGYYKNIALIHLLTTNLFHRKFKIAVLLSTITIIKTKKCRCPPSSTPKKQQQQQKTINSNKSAELIQFIQAKQFFFYSFLTFFLFHFTVSITHVSQYLKQREHNSRDGRKRKEKHNCERYIGIQKDTALVIFAMDIPVW